MCVVFAAVGFENLTADEVLRPWSSCFAGVALFACVQLPVLYPVPSFAITLLAGSLGGQ